MGNASDLTDVAKADHKNLERSNVRDPRNEVPQAKEQEIGKSDVDAVAATQGPAEQQLRRQDRSTRIVDMVAEGTMPGGLDPHGKWRSPATPPEQSARVPEIRDSP